MQRLGYGTLTAWVSNCENLTELGEELEMQKGVKEVRIQPLVFAGYLMNGSHSDNDGELIAYRPEEFHYHFYNDGLDGYRKDTVIQPGKIYLSPAMKSSFHVEVGDEIRFELSRADTGLPFTVAGFFEDPFMGSSMVDMKSFLISEADYEKLIHMMDERTAFNLLGRQGAMMHIFSEESAGLRITELDWMLNAQTSLGVYSEMTYSFDTIYGFMLLLQNILTGFLIAFSGLLLAATKPVLSIRAPGAIVGQGVPQVRIKGKSNPKRDAGHVAGHPAAAHGMEEIRRGTDRYCAADTVCIRCGQDGDMCWPRISLRTVRSGTTLWTR